MIALLRRISIPRDDRPTFYLARWVFLRLLGLCYLAAFASFWTQVHGLVGSHGILPVAPLLDRVREVYGPESWWRFPTLLWIDSSDRALDLLCGGGVALSILLVLGLAQVPVLLLLWAFYLSLQQGGQAFMSFQWDILLLEVGFLAVFLAPWKLGLGLARSSPPPPAIHWLFRWLLFRFMFSSGVVKLNAGDPAWWNMTALQFHYETQPLPTWIGWWVHQLPPIANDLSCLVMFLVELVVPFLALGPRRCRAIAFLSIAGLMAVVMLTGNYTFFNWLTIAIAVLLVDDSQWPEWMRRRLSPPEAPRRAWPWWAILPIVSCVWAITGWLLYATIAKDFELPERAQKVWEKFDSFNTFNSYGLFRVMTRPRYEIVIEGSDDGEHWKEYEFRWKPGDPTRRPAFVAPHQPRLDWQMWFAALRSPREREWFLSLMQRLLEGTPEVLSLLERNPFPDHPPRQARASYYEYHFTDPQTLAREGTWWRREKLGPYCQPVSLKRR